MHTVLKQIRPETVEMLAAQAKAHGLSVDEYLKSLLRLTNGEHVTTAPTLTEFVTDMQALAEDTEHLPPESLAYSRRDIYFDHD